MSPRLKEFFLRWLINTIAVLMASLMLTGIHYQRPQDLLAASLLLGILNAFVRPLLLLLSLPLVIVTLGLFVLVINALLLEFIGWLLTPHFTVGSFGTAFIGGLIITLFSAILGSLTGINRSSFRVRRNAPPRNRDDRGGNGPVIDI